MNESWDGEDIAARASPKSGQGGFPSGLVRWRYYDVAFGLVMPVVCFGLEFVLLPALGWLPGLVFFHLRSGKGSRAPKANRARLFDAYR
jgi:hypothetical protein